MPPHCDTLDGPVVNAARKALETNDIDKALPFVKEQSENEVKKIFDLAIVARKQGQEAKEAADLLFFETVVRLHREGEGENFTGIKPAGLDTGPVVPVAENAIESGDPDQLIKKLTTVLDEEIQKRFHHLMELKQRSGEGLKQAREFTEASLGLQVWSHKLYGTIQSEAHGEGEAHKH